MFHFTTTTKALERNTLVISSSQMERIIFPTAHEGSIRLWFLLTQLVFPRVVGDLHDVELQAVVALPDGVDAHDVRTPLAHLLHQLQGRGGRVRFSLGSLAQMLSARFSSSVMLTFLIAM